MRPNVYTSLLLLVGLACAGCKSDPGNVIFIHPDGASSATWGIARALYVGPDNDLVWDTIPELAVYRGHMADSLVATSNGGATSHATGVKVESDAFGRVRGGADAPRLVDEDGKPLSVALQALDAGLGVGLVQTGIASEPGTACFVTDAASRGNHDAIVAQLVESGCQVMLGGGERYFLPKGVTGRHGKGERTDGRNLIEEAKQAGYTVVYDREELAAVREGTTQLLGVFAFDATFNDDTEEKLKEKNLFLYEPEAPSVGEMTEAALKVLEANDERFLLVVEEEGTDNFGNRNNAVGVLEACRRADEALGVAQRYVQDNDDTLLITCADSDGGGMRMRGIVIGEGHTTPRNLPDRDRNGAPIDGVAGTGSAPFTAQPDRFGNRLPFAVYWPSLSDVAGGVIVRAQGYNSEQVKGSMDNTEVAELMRYTLFGG